MPYLKRIVIFFAILLSSLAIYGQQTFVSRPLAANVIMPQSRTYAIVPAPATVQITQVEAGIWILEQMASVNMDIHLYNPGHTRLEAELIVPVPAAAVIKGFTFQGGASEPMAQILPKEEARRIYDQIVAKVRDPALLEFVGYNLIRSSVFPVEPGGRQKIRLSYEQLLAADGSRYDFFLPRSQSFQPNIPWNIAVKIQSQKPISTAYSPTHKMNVMRVNEHCMNITLGKEANEPGHFRLSYLLEEKGVTASLFTYPDPAKGGGYFLFLAGLPAALPQKSETQMRREVTLVIDRSGSMRGEKLKQTMNAAWQILLSLSDGEAFNIIAYNHVVELFSTSPVIKNKASMESALSYLNGIIPSGGTNIYEALVEALRQKPTEGMLPIMLFLSDGLPTIGQTSEKAIRSMVTQANSHKRRIFTFGVGLDVNTPLLENIASSTRGYATFIFPQEDVKDKVWDMFKRLSQPVISDLRLQVHDAQSQNITRVQDVIPAVLPDLFSGDQLVVIGRYLGENPLVFDIEGNYLGQTREFHYTFGLDKATTRNSFVPRLWASRQIAMLIDAIRQLGADSPNTPGSPTPIHDPRFKELVEEVVRLSTEFGILTEYTAFLSREGTDLSARDNVVREAQRNFVGRAWQTRSGLSSINQEVNSQTFKNQKSLNMQNSYYDAQMNRVAISEVQQIHDVALYRRGNRWLDSRIVNQESQIQPKKVIEFGTEDFRNLLTRLAEEGRQACIAFPQDVLLMLDGEIVLVKAIK